MMFITTWPPFPSVIAYKLTKGCGALRAYSVFRSGVQKRKRITTVNPRTALATAEEKIPRAAVRLAFLVSSLI